MKEILKLLPPQSYFDLYQEIVQSKRDQDVKRALNGARAIIAARYALLENAIDNSALHTVTEEPNLRYLADELRSCYGNKPKKLKVIFDGIKNAQVNRILERCPYCGMTLPKTHDHYLPESRFPEFSAHALNLVPCCHECNSVKGNRWKNGGRRIFYHFYSDIAPQHQFLFVSLITRQGARGFGTQFSIARPASITNNDVWALVESHFDELNLLERFKDQANNEISSTFDTCVSHLEDRGASVERFLSEMSRRYRAVFGANHWRIVLWDALAQNQIFIALVELEAIT